MPRPITHSTTPNHTYDVSASNWVSARKERPTSVRPTGTIRPTPVLSLSRPAIGIEIIAPKPCGASSRPVSIALSPRTTCR